MSDDEIDALEKLIRSGITSYFTIEKVLEHDVLLLIKEVRELRSEVKLLRSWNGE